MLRRSLFKWLAAWPAARLLAIIPLAGAAPVPKPLLFVWAGERHKGNVLRPQRGDVVSVHPNTIYPGNAILGNPEWRLIEVDIQVDNPIESLAWLTVPDDAPEGYLFWFRRHTLDLDRLEQATALRLNRPLAADDRLSITPDALRAIAKVKLAMPDPRWA